MNLSIIIVNWNTRELLAQCLQSVEESVGTPRYAQGRLLKRWNPTLRSGQAVETFVVDNASTDGSAALVRARFPWVHLIANDENAGFARANNQAIAQSRGRYVLLLNSDTKVLPGALETLLAFMDAHPKAGACGPLLLNADGSLQPSCHPILTPWREFWRLTFLEQIIHKATYPQARWERQTSHRVEVIKGACLLLRRKVLDQIGLLDDRYFMYTEEMDLCYRLAQAGWQCYWVPQARVIHYGEASTRQMAEAMYVQLYRSKVQFQRKFGGEKRALWFKFLLTLAYLPRWVVASLGQIFIREWKPRARTYRRLLRALPTL